MKILILSAILFTISAAFAAKEQKASKKDMSFDSQVVEGLIYRPDYSVVTGEAPGEGWGLLRLRDQFRDHAATDAEESKK